MKASQVKISELKTYDEMADAIDSIESDYQNVVGGFNAWKSGYATELTKSAQKKIEAIEKKMDRVFGCDDGN